MENDSTLYVGLDVHKDSITVVYALGNDEVELLGKIGTTQADIERLCKRLQSKARRVCIVYEAGPCGYGLYRELVQKAFDCMVCAPSMIPRKPGERVKTDRRDAAKLVRLLRAGDLSAVYVPSVEDEAFRDLARAWVSAKDDLKRARQRLKAFLLSHGVRYAGRADWGPAYRRWVSTYAFASAWQQLAFEEHRPLKNIGARSRTGSHNASVSKQPCAKRSLSGVSIRPSSACRPCVACSSPRRWACLPNWAICHALSIRAS